MSLSNKSLLSLSLLFIFFLSAILVLPRFAYAGEFNVSFPSATNTKRDLQVVLDYNDNLFSQKAGSYNDSLAYASVCLASASGNSSAETDYTNKGKNIRAFLGSEGIGCSDVQLNGGYTARPTEKSNTGVAIGHKDITVNEGGTDKSYKLFVVGVRGISYEAEWATNLLVGESGDHRGFAEARDSVLGFILPYIAEHTTDGDNIKIWISGYSRGGAVANLVGGWLDSWIKDSVSITGVTPEVQYARDYDKTLMRNTVSAKYNLSGRNLSASDIYCYSVSAPQGVDKANIDSNNQYCVGIHNIINPDDWISQIAMSWWNFGRYGTDHDPSGTYTTPEELARRDKAMINVNAEKAAATIQRLQKINSGAAYSAPWFKQYYFSLWSAGAVEDTKGDGTKFIDNPKKLAGYQGKYFEECGQFFCSALSTGTRGAYVSGYQDDLAYLASLTIGLSAENNALLSTSLKTNLTNALRVQLNLPKLNLESPGVDAFKILNMVKNDLPGFTTVCEATLANTFKELNVSYDSAKLKNAAATLAKCIRLSVNKDGTYFYHLLTVAKNANGIGQAHYPELALAWWEASGKDPVSPAPTPVLEKKTLKFYGNYDGEMLPKESELVVQSEIIEGDMLFISDAEQPKNPDGSPLDNGVLYYETPVMSNSTFVCWATKPDSDGNSEFYDSEDGIYYGDLEEGETELYALWQDDATYGVRYHANTGNSNEPAPIEEYQYAENEKLSFSSSRFKNGSAEFVAWNTKADGSGLTVSAGSAVSLNALGLPSTDEYRAIMAVVEDEESFEAALEKGTVDVYARWQTAEPEPVATQSMYRLYNPNSGEHFYTADKAERDNVVSLGWHDEGVGWTAPDSSSVPVYRLYNAIGGEHHYTMDPAERDNLISLGWNDEGIGWYSDEAQGQVLYREYNPNQFSCNHNYTADRTEHDYLVSIGWRDEGYAWYGLAG